MKRSVIALLTFIIIMKFVKLESCYFDFEKSDELQNFDTTCKGIIGKWEIVKAPDIPSLGFEVGTSALTTAQAKAACMITKKNIKIPKNLHISADFYLHMVNNYDAVELLIELWNEIDSPPISTMKIQETGFSNNHTGEWIRRSHHFVNDEGEYRIAIKMFRNGAAEVLLDKILLDNVTLYDCYMKPSSTDLETFNEAPDPSTTSTTKIYKPTTDTSTTDKSTTSPSSTSSTEFTYSTASTSTTESSSPIVTTESHITSAPTEPSYRVLLVFYLVAIIIALVGVLLLSACATFIIAGTSRVWCEGVEKRLRNLF